MKNKRPPSFSPIYKGKNWIKVRLPREARDWTHGGSRSIARDGDSHDSLISTLNRLNERKAWEWPKQRHYFLSDLHGEPEAFAASLVASGGVKKTGPGPRDFALTKVGRDARFVIGGDCFDKGTSSLELLRSIQHLRQQGANLRLLAGNHDVRVLLGMVVVGPNKDPQNEHFFIRTGQKIIPLLKEIWDEYLKDGDKLKGIPGKRECRRRLYPRKGWYERFPKIAEGTVKPAQINRELSRIRKKQERFEKLCAEQGLSLRHVYAAVEKWKELFLTPKGEFSWFFKRLRIGYRAGSFLFVHAGLDDAISKELKLGGVKALNQGFRKALRGPPFDFYYGSLCNTIRTKYRAVDRPFTEKGAREVRRAGISAVVHGHRNLRNGQRLAGRRTLLSFECDASLDSQTRKKEKVRGHGAAVTIIEPKGRILGISSDYPYVKVFEPGQTLAELRKGQKKSRQSR